MLGLENTQGPGPHLRQVCACLRVKESRNWSWQALSKTGLVLDEAQRSAPPLISAHSKSKNMYCWKMHPSLYFTPLHICVCLNFLKNHISAIKKKGAPKSVFYLVTYRDRCLCPESVIFRNHAELQWADRVRQVQGPSNFSPVSQCHNILRTQTYIKT